MLETVVLIHGIWMTGADMLLLGKRVNDCGYSSHIFHYQSVDKSPALNAEYLAKFVTKLKEPKVHFVSHSLGGVVLLNYLNRAKAQKKGRVVLLGTPINGSESAKNAIKTPLFKQFLGQSINKGLLNKAPKWQGDREVGMIAGNKSLGLGMFTGDLPSENDGTVLLSETKYDALTAHLTLNVSHSELLFSSEVSNNVCSFLINGQFGQYQTNIKRNNIDSWLDYFNNVINKADFFGS